MSMATPPAENTAIENLSQRNTASAIKAASPASVHLDAVRGLAALVVFVSHWRYLFFADYPQLSHAGAAAKVFYALTGLGHSAVMVFFILSGFFISSSVLRARQQGRWSWTWYAEQRLTRLYVVLVPALLLGALWDLIGLHVFRDAPVYLGGTDYQLMLTRPAAQLDTVQSWLGSLFFLQGIRTPVFGTNGPLWSLSYEFWYYALFPICWLALSRHSAILPRAAYLAAGLLIFAFVGKVIAVYFVVWLFGTALCFGRLARPFASRGASKAALSLLSLLFAAALLAPRFKLIPNGFLSDFCVAVTFSALLFCLLNFPYRTPSALYVKSARALSNISYSLYLLHVPFLILLNALIIRQGSRWQPTAGHMVLAIFAAAIVFLYTYGVWYYTEARTGQVREKIASLIVKSRPAAANIQ